MNRRNVIKWILYAVLAIVFSTIEARLSPHVRIFGVSPGFGAALTVSVAIYEGAAGGAFFGLACGALEYLAPGDAETVYMLAYMLGGYTVGMFCDYVLSRSLAAALLTSLILNAVSTLLFFVFMMAVPQNAGLAALGTAGVAEIVMCTAVTPLVYFPVREISRRWNIIDQ